MASASAVYSEAHKSALDEASSVKTELKSALAEVHALRAQLAAAKAEAREARPMLEGELELRASQADGFDEDSYRRELAETLGVKAEDIDLEVSS